MWLSSEHRLGRVGALKWSAVATTVSFLLLIASLRVQAMFAVVMVVSQLITGDVFL